MADVIVVNSEFTKDVFKQTFQTLSSKSAEISVLYPAIELEQFDTELSQDQVKEAKRAFPLELKEKLKLIDEGESKAKCHFLLSINRFERKKNLSLAVYALGVLLQKQDYESVRKGKTVCLILAGGYDPRLEENVEYMKELKRLVLNLGLEKHVFFVPSFTDDQRVLLLQLCTCVVYTPDKEHFGIVPIEAMYAARPVVAVASGGPLESIVHEETGFLQEQTPQAFAEALAKIIQDETRAFKIGVSGRKHVAAKFSLDAFADQLDQVCAKMANDAQHKYGPTLFFFSLVVALIASLYIYMQAQQ